MEVFMAKHRFLFVLLCAPFLLCAQEKYALVIGNAEYTAVSRLRNTVNDAGDMKAVLEGLGFRTELLANASLRQMNEAVDRFSRRLSASPDSYGFFFYSGHGVQSAGENYLIPVNANIRREADLQYEALNVQRALDYIQEAGNNLNVIVLDACRDNPFGWARSGTRGLTVTGRQPPQSIIVYATSAGSTASDGTGRNGVFTAHLLNNLKTPGLEISEVFRRTGADVRRASNNRQIPAVYSQFFDTAYLGSQPPAPAPAAQTAVQPAPADSPAADRMVGTEWNLSYTINGSAKSFKVEFLTGGKLKLSNPADNTPENDRWEQKANALFLYFNDSYVTYEGRPAARNFIKGLARNVAGETWEFELRKN
jgi:hypothetical protein